MKRTLSNIEVIDLTFSSEDESEDFFVRSDLFVREEVISDVLPVEERVLHISSRLPKIPKFKTVRTDLPMDFSCGRGISVPNSDVKQVISTGCSTEFNPLPNRFYCFCNKTQTNHAHEKCLAMRGLTNDRRVYWTCRTRSKSSISGCSFFAWDQNTRTLD